MHDREGLSAGSMSSDKHKVISVRSPPGIIYETICFITLDSNVDRWIGPSDPAAERVSRHVIWLFIILAIGSKVGRLLAF